MGFYNSANARTVPSPQELSSLDPSVLATEITNIEAVLANRYNPNGSFAELCDKLSIEGKSEERAFWTDLVRYRANLYAAKRVQAIESATGGIGMLDVRTNDANPRPRGDCGWY